MIKNELGFNEKNIKIDARLSVIEKADSKFKSRGFY